MKGRVMVDPGGVEADEDLKDWVRLAAKFVGKLPPRA
jgi:hypothetical protein